MSVAAQVLLSPQTALGNSGVISRSNADGPFTIVAGGLTGAETVTMQVQDASGNWQTVPAAIAPQLTASIAALTMNFPGVFRFAKSATAGAVGVVLYGT